MNADIREREKHEREKKMKELDPFYVIPAKLDFMELLDSGLRFRGNRVLIEVQAGHSEKRKTAVMSAFDRLIARMIQDREDYILGRTWG
jgi:hypothetical protein